MFYLVEQIDTITETDHELMETNMKTNKKLIFYNLRVCQLCVLSV